MIYQQFYKLSGIMHLEKSMENPERRKKMEEFRNQLKKNLKIKKITCNQEKWISLPEINEEIVSPTELHNETEQFFKAKYKIIEKIGEGSSAIVYRCQQNKTGQKYAVKMACYEPDQIHQLKEIFQAIIDLQHPSIIKYKAIYICSHKNKAYLIMQDFGFPDLTMFHIKDELEIRNVAQKLLEAVDYLHLNGICHRDIKPGNILYNPKTKEIRLIDFNVSKKTRKSKSAIMNQEMLTPTGTPHYRAPETYAGSIYEEIVDEWSVGACLYQIITNTHPFKFCNHEDHPSYFCNYESCLKKLFTEKVWKNYSSHCIDLISQLLKPANQRITACKALKHLWFAINLDSGHRLPHKVKQMVKKNSFENKNYRFLEQYSEKAESSLYCQKKFLIKRRSHSSIQLKSDLEEINSVKRKIIKSKLMRAETGNTNESDEESFLIDSDEEKNNSDIFMKKQAKKATLSPEIEESLCLRTRPRKFTT